jgi:ABC-2 type transport system permease protein
MIFGYVTALTGASSGSANELVKVLAYIPPTAPFDMPVLVGASEVSWWGFSISVALSLVATVATARLAAMIYRRAILRTGRRVKYREVFARTAK